MPCYDTRDRATLEALTEIAELTERNNHLAQMLCSICRQFEARGLNVPQVALEWWTEHKWMDEAREKASAELRKHYDKS